MGERKNEKINSNPFANDEPFIFHFGFSFFYISVLIGWLWISTQNCRVNQIERDTIFIKYIYVPYYSKIKSVDESELEKKLKSDEKTKRRKRRAQRTARHSDADKVHGGGGGGTSDAKKSSGHHRHELKDGLIGDSMNKHSSGNSNPNVLNGNSSDSNNRRGSNSGSGEQHKKSRGNHRRRYHGSQGNSGLSADGHGVKSSSATSPSPKVTVVVSKTSIVPRKKQPSSLGGGGVGVSHSVDTTAGVIRHHGHHSKHGGSSRYGNSNSSLNARVVQGSGGFNANVKSGNLMDLDRQRSGSGHSQGSSRPHHRGHAHAHRSHQQHTSRPGTLDSISANPHLRNPMSQYGSLMGSLMSVTTTVMHSPNVSFEITADTLTRADISTPYTAPDDMSVIDEVSMARNGKENEIDVETVRLDQITSSGKIKGRRGAPKVQKFVIENDEMKKQIAETGNLSIVEHKNRIGKHKRIQNLHGRKNTWGSITVADASTMGQNSASITATVVDDPHGQHGQHGGGGHYKNSQAGKPNLDNISEHSNEASSRSSNPTEDISLVIYEFEYVLSTAPEKYNQMDFNNLQYVDDYSLAMTFGGPDRLQELFNHLYTVCHHNSFNNQEAPNDIDNPNIQNPNQQVAMCFLLTQRYSDVVYRILERVGLIDFFTSTIRGTNQKLSHVIGWDHKLMQENEAKQHLILLKLILFLKRKHDSVLYVGHNQDTIEHLRRMNACQTYHVKTKGMTNKDFEYISKNFLNIDFSSDQFLMAASSIEDGSEMNGMNDQMVD